MKMGRPSPGTFLMRLPCEMDRGCALPPATRLRLTRMGGQPKAGRESDAICGTRPYYLNSSKSTLRFAGPASVAMTITIGHGKEAPASVSADAAG